MMRAGVIALLATCALSAQKRPAYEVASFKLDTSGIGGSSSDGSRGQIVFTNVTLKRLIERAYASTTCLCRSVGKAARWQSLSSQLSAIDPAESTDEAIGGWSYWVARGYCL